MRRTTILILSAVGIGAGFVFALGSNRGRSSKGEDGSLDPCEKDTREGSRVLGASALHKSESNSERETPHQADSMARIENGVATFLEDNVEPEIDDRGTDQSEASRILKNIRDTAFDSSDEKLALALGRPIEEIEDWTKGVGLIDGDAVMKARALALQRGLELG